MQDSGNCAEDKQQKPECIFQSLTLVIRNSVQAWLQFTAFFASCIVIVQAAGRQCILKTETLTEDSIKFQGVARLFKCVYARHNSSIVWEADCMAIDRGNNNQSLWSIIPCSTITFSQSSDKIFCNTWSLSAPELILALHVWHRKCGCTWSGKNVWDNKSNTSCVSIPCFGHMLQVSCVFLSKRLRDLLENNTWSLMDVYSRHEVILRDCDLGQRKKHRVLERV